MHSSFAILSKKRIWSKNLIQINTRIKGSFDDIKYSVFSRDLQKGDIINELNYSKLGEEINELNAKENTDDTKDVNEENTNNPNQNVIDTNKDDVIESSEFQ